MPQRKQKVKQGQHKRKRRTQAAAEAIFENAEAKSEVDRMCKGNTMSDGVVTANETDGTARMPGDEHSDRNTTKVETDRNQGEDHQSRFPHLVGEAGCIVLHVSNNMNVVFKNTMKTVKTVKKKAGQQQERLKWFQERTRKFRRRNHYIK